MPYRSDGLDAEDLLPSESDLGMMWLDRSVLAVVDEGGRSRPWVDPVLTPHPDDGDGTAHGDDDDDLDDDFDDEDDDDDDLLDGEDLDDDDEEDDDEDDDDDEDADKGDHHL